MNWWTRMSTPTKIVLSAQGLALLYAIHKRSHVTSIVTGMTIVGTALAEWQAQKSMTSSAVTTPTVATTELPPAATISSLGQLRSVR